MRIGPREKSALLVWAVIACAVVAGEASGDTPPPPFDPLPTAGDVAASPSVAAPTTSPTPSAADFNPTLINDPFLSAPARPGAPPGVVLRAQVLLDRANFSVGEIDAAYGTNTRKAIVAFQRAHGLEATGEVDLATWATLSPGIEPALITYVITSEDVSGPFVRIPSDMMKKARLPWLGYQDPLEGLAEKFHASPALLMLLNPEPDFEVSGTEILVPNVLDVRPPHASAIVVDASDRTIRVLGNDGRVVAHFPATVGSSHDPLPIGRWEINGRSWDPHFYYNPRLFWDADRSHAPAKLAPGPNSPVGIVWIDLSRDHYGIHGTPEPSKISRTFSHGCIRLTNWDAARLAQMIAVGTPAILQR